MGKVMGQEKHYIFYYYYCHHHHNHHYYEYVYKGCPRRNVPDFEKEFRMLKNTDITQNTYVQSYGYGNKGARKVWSSCGSTYCTWLT